MTTLWRLDVEVHGRQREFMFVEAHSSQHARRAVIAHYRAEAQTVNELMVIIHGHVEVEAS